MIKRTIDISEGPSFLSIEADQLVITRERQEVGRVPCEDVGLLLVDNHWTIRNMPLGGDPRLRVYSIPACEQSATNYSPVTMPLFPNHTNPPRKLKCPAEGRMSSSSRQTVAGSQ